MRVGVTGGSGGVHNRKEQSTRSPFVNRIAALVRGSARHPSLPCPAQTRGRALTRGLKQCLTLRLKSILMLLPFSRNGPHSIINEAPVPLPTPLPRAIL